MKRIISTEKAPQAIGPYSQAVASNGVVYLSGQIPINPATGSLLDGDTASQTELVLENLKAVLEASGTTLGNVLKVTVFLKDMEDFAAMNEVYARYFTTNPPARAAVEVARLPKDVRVEMDAIAAVA